jgi:cell fate (sporulation/competence/biofilm development) regulator YlbF (YheA/YmcA/DUF963 family)
MDHTILSNDEKDRLLESRTRLINSISGIEKQMYEIPKETSANSRIRIVRAFEEKENELKLELKEVEQKISEKDTKNNNEDKFLFLNSLSNLTGLNRDDLFTAIVLSIVIMIDPLAISLILSGSFIVSGLRKDKLLNQEKMITDLKHEEEILEDSLEESTDQLVERVEESIEKNGGVITNEDMEAILQIEKNESILPARTRKRLIKIRDYLKGEA